MPDTLDSAENSPVAPDRRVQVRQSIRSLAYVDLGFGNGGIILNISEGGLAVRAVTALMDKSLPKMRFQPTASKEWIEVGGEIAWTGESNTMAGVRFVELGEESRAQIHDWIALEAVPTEPPKDHVARSLERKPKEHPAVESPAAPKAGVHEPPTEELQPATQAPLTEPPQIELAKPPVPDARIAPVEALAFPAPLAAEKIPERRAVVWSQNRKQTAAFAAFFAAASLAAGWIVGRGTWNSPFAGIQASGSSNSLAASAAGRALGIEVVDSGDHRWIVPFNGPAGGPSGSPVAPTQRTAAGKSAPRADSTVSSAPVFPIWKPSAPNNAGGQRPTGTSGVAPSIDINEPSAGLFRSTSPGPDAPAVASRTASYQDGALIRRVEPIYPAVAQQLHLQGVVKLRVQVGPDGLVKKVDTLSGPQILMLPAVTAVRQWRYQPSTLDGKAIEVEKNVEVQFHLTQ